MCLLVLEASTELNQSRKEEKVEGTQYSNSPEQNSNWVVLNDIHECFLLLYTCTCTCTSPFLDVFKLKRYAAGKHYQSVV